MTKEDIKKAILSGIASGITIVITAFILIWVQTELSSWYREYKEEQAINRGAASHCGRDGLKEFVDSMPTDTTWIIGNEHQ